MEKKDYGYLQFPLCLLKETYANPERGLNLMISYGIVNYALKLKYDMKDVAKQTLYYYDRKRDVLQSYLVKRLNDFVESGDILYEEGNPGFDSSGSFSPEEDFCLNPLLKMFDEDQQMKEEAILNYKLHLATSKDHLNLNIGSDTATIKQYVEATKIKSDFEQQFGPDAMPCCKNRLLFDFRDKNLKDIDLLRAYIGISSMIGQRKFISTNKPAILSRMIGCKTKAAFEHYTSNKYGKDKNILPAVEKYNKRYHMDKLMMTLVERKLIMFLSQPNVSIIYISKYMEPEELGELVKQSRFRYDIKRRMKEVTASL